WRAVTTWRSSGRGMRLPNPTDERLVPFEWPATPARRTLTRAARPTIHAGHSTRSRVKPASIILAATCAFAVTLLPAPAGSQQLPDSAFSPPVARPAFAAGKGPMLCLDEAHHNFHTLDNRFYAFGALARRDGFRVSASRAPFTAQSLARCQLLVISNAQ